MLGQIPSDRVNRRRQEAAPLDLEMANGRGIAAPGIGALGSIEVDIDLGHRRSIRAISPAVEIYVRSGKDICGSNACNTAWALRIS